MKAVNEIKAQNLEAKEQAIQERLERINTLEKELLKKEKALKAKEVGKKQVLLRLAPSLWDEIASWAEEDFRSINGQIEYLLADAVKRRKK